VKEGQRYIRTNSLYIYIYRLPNRGPALPGKNLMHFLLSKGFFPVICLGFGAWGTPWSGGRVGRAIHR